MPIRRQKQRQKREGGASLLVTTMLLLILGLLGFAALQTTTRDQQVAGFQKRKKQSRVHVEANSGDVVIIPLLLEPCVIPVLLADKAYADFTGDYRTGIDTLLRSVQTLAGSAPTAAPRPTGISKSTLAMTMVASSSASTRARREKQHPWWP